MINNRLVNICLITLGGISVFLTLFPKIDMVCASLFYFENSGFIYKNNFFVSALFYSIPFLTKIFVSGCCCYLIFIFYKYRNLKNIFNSGAFFLIITAIITPGLIVNLGLKENIGRARPREIIEFAGSKTFTGAAIPTDQCDSNCSFPSGHAAMGFYYTALAYVGNREKFGKIYLAGLLFGAAVGLSRIIMGGHFLSDVIISGFLVTLSNQLIFLLWKR